MIYVGTNVPVVDKSGAKKALCICILKGLKIASVGDIVIAVIKKAVKKKTTKKLATKGKIYPALVIRSKKVVSKLSGLKVHFQTKGIILLRRLEKEPFSIRIFGPVSIELREKGFVKILSMASFVI